MATSTTLQPQQLHQGRRHYQRGHSRNGSLSTVILQEQMHSLSITPTRATTTPIFVEYSAFEKELFVYLTNPSNSAEYEAAYKELQQEVNGSQISRYFSTGDLKFPIPQLTCGATGEEFVEWRDAFLAILGPLAKTMINMTGEDEEAQDDQLELIEKVLADTQRPEYAKYLKEQGTYKYVCLVRDYNAQIFQLVCDNVSSTLYNLFISTKSSAVAYSYIKTRFSTKMWTKSIYSLASIPTSPTVHLEEFTILKTNIVSARIVQPCEVTIMEFSFIMEFLRSRRDIRDHPCVANVYPRLSSLYQKNQSILSKDIDLLLASIERAIQEIAQEDFTSPPESTAGSPYSSSFPTSVEALTKKARARGRRRRSVQIKPGDI